MPPYCDTTSNYLTDLFFHKHNSWSSMRWEKKKKNAQWCSLSFVFDTAALLLSFFRAAASWCNASQLVAALKQTGYWSKQLSVTDGTARNVSPSPVVLSGFFSGAGWSTLLLFHPRKAPGRRSASGIQWSPKQWQVLLSPRLRQRQNPSSQVLRGAEREIIERPASRVRCLSHALVSAKCQGFSRQGLLFKRQFFQFIAFRTTFARLGTTWSSPGVFILEKRRGPDVDSASMASCRQPNDGHVKGLLCSTVRSARTPPIYPQHHQLWCFLQFWGCLWSHKKGHYSLISKDLS